LPKANAPQPRANDLHDSTTDQLSTAANPQMLLRSAPNKDSEQSVQCAVEGDHPGIAKDSELSALVSQPVIPPVPISLPPQGNIESGLPAQVGTSEIQSAWPNPLDLKPVFLHIMNFKAIDCDTKTSLNVLFL